MTDERCPRCGHELQEGGVRPALSRWDDQTRVCAWCGEHEALQQALDGSGDTPGEMTPRELWWDRYSGGPVDDYRLVLAGRGTTGDRVTVEVEAQVAELRRRMEEERE